MIDPHVRNEIRRQIQGLVADERGELARLREMVAPLASSTRPIQPRSATAISLVGTDGGNNQIRFDPFLLQLVRVVDSSSNELLLDAVTPRTSTKELNSRHIGPDGHAFSALGRLVLALGASTLEQVCPVLRESGTMERSPSWVQEYRGLAEWAALFDLICNRQYATDTLVVRDGPLREKMFAKGIFRRMMQLIEDSISATFAKTRRRIYVVGVSKHSKVLQKFRLAFALEGILRTKYPAYVQVPEDLQQATFRYQEWMKNASTSEEYFKAGTMFMAKFGRAIHDPIWIVDIIDFQVTDAPRVMGYLQKDAQCGFPIPYYPQCLQRAHDAAALVDFDLDILDLEVRDALKKQLGRQSRLVDELAIVESDVSQQRY